MRRVAIVLMAVGVATAGCVAPPPANEPNPFACGPEPVDLGFAGRVEAVSADGNTIVVRTSADGGGLGYDVIDRRAGERYTMKTTSPLGDGAAIFMNEAGTLIYGYQYPSLESGEMPWFAHDVATRATNSFDPPIDAGSIPSTFSSDLRHFVAQRTAPTGSPPVTWELVDFLSGATTPLGVSTDPAWRTAGFSPDLSLVVQYSAPTSFSKYVRVLDTATGSVAFDLGRVSNENRFYVAVRFVDNQTVLVNDAVPFGATPDGINDDGAFLVDVPSGTTTRIDPGVANASTTQATADGRRTVFAIVNAIQTWVRIDGRNELLVDTFSGTASQDISIVVTADDGRATLHCF